MHAGRKDTPGDALDQPSPGRLEAFSDGVIAVIITIMVLELKIPPGHGLAGLIPILKTVGVYAISYTFVGIYWVNHHHQIHRLRHVNAAILYANLLLLFFLSLLPFFTSYMIAKGLDSFSVAVYAGSLVTSGFSFLVLTRAIGRHKLRSGDVHSDAELQRQIAGDRKGVLSQAMYTLAIPLAYWRPAVALLDIALVSLVWVVPGFLLPPVHSLAGRLGGEMEPPRG